MLIAQSLLAEFEAQAPVTRRFLERLPDDKLAWKPHPRSLTAGQLAYHLAFVPGGVVLGAQKDQIPPPDFQFHQPTTVQEVLDALDQSISTVREVLPSFDDAAMNATWRIVERDQEIAAMPRVAFLRNIMLNHWYQHRGQFCVYLRLLDVPVPSAGVLAPTSVQFSSRSFSRRNPSANSSREDKPMCPFCITTAMMIAGGVTSTSGVAAFAIRKLGVRNAADNQPVATPTKLSRKMNGAGEIVPNANQRRDQDVNEHD